MIVGIGAVFELDFCFDDGRGAPCGGGRPTNQGSDQSIYVQDGWNMIKKEISENESFYTQEKCASVGKQWAKMLVAMRKK